MSHDTSAADANFATASGRAKLWWNKQPPNALIPLDTPLDAKGLQQLGKAPVRIREAWERRGYPRRNGVLFQDIAAELHLHPRQVERELTLLPAPAPTKKETAMPAEIAATTYLNQERLEREAAAVTEQHRQLLTRLEVLLRGVTPQTLITSNDDAEEAVKALLERLAKSEAANTRLEKLANEADAAQRVLQEHGFAHGDTSLAEAIRHVLRDRDQILTEAYGDQRRVPILSRSLSPEQRRRALDFAFRVVYEDDGASLFFDTNNLPQRAETLAQAVTLVRWCGEGDSR